METTKPINFFESENDVDLEAEFAPQPSEGEVVPYTYEQAVAEVEQITDAEQRQVLLDMLERNRTASLLKVIDTEQAQESRQQFLQVVMENFVAKRMRANNIIEDLRYKVAGDLLANSEYLDNETRIMLLEKLTTSTQADAGRAASGIGAGAGFMPPPTTQIVLNNNNGEGTQTVVAPSTMEVNPIKLDKVNHLNETLRMWMTVGAPVKTTDAAFEETKEPADGADNKADKPV